MQRQVKFRTWNYKTNQIYPGIDWEIIGSYKIWLECPQEVLNSTYKGLKIFTQFTGLLDKNGAEIYDGDIVKEVTTIGPDLPERYRDTAKGSEIIKEIKWGNYYDGEFVNQIECWMFGDADSLSELIHRTKSKYQPCLKTYEVIGSIFQNKDLLDKTS